MKFHIKYLLLITALVFTISTYAKLPTGQWQTHMSYVDGQRLAVSDNKVYVVASGSLFSYGFNDNAIETYSKISGLNDVYINDIAFCTMTETLVICYGNGNIDLLSKEGVINIPDLYLKPIYGDKTINKVDIFDGTAYLSTAFGILKLNISKAEISETYKLSNGDPNGTNGVAILDNDIYAATDNGLYKANLDNPNLQDFATWSLISTYANPTMPIRDISTFSNSIVIAQFNTNDKYYYIRKQNSNNQWEQFARMYYFNSFGANDDFLLLANENTIIPFNQYFQEQARITSYNFSELEFGNQNRIYVNHSIPIDENSFLIADRYQGLVIYKRNSHTLALKPNGPATNTIWDINIEQNILRTVHGGTTQDYNNTWFPGAYSSYINKEWNHYAIYNDGVGLRDFVGIITDPLDINHFYISTYGYGVLEYQDNELVLQYNEHNSSLENAIPGSDKYVRTIGMAFDQDNNLWVNNSSSLKQFHVKTTENDWYAFESNLPKARVRYTKILILDNGDKWIVSPYFGDGILAYRDNGTFDDASDDEDRYFSVYDLVTDEFISDNVEDIALDKDGVVWVGSDNGVARFYNPSNIFESNINPKASRINIPRNDGTGLGDYLLDGTTVTSIAVDGGNRKWLATASTGVMLVSSDGLNVVHHFTKENSPLLSNNIRQVEINQVTGEVYFATEAGLISFQADATTGENDFSNIMVYPNPVREDFFGDITITGLVDETRVKITDVSGNLVNETTSNGGTAVWNGKNFYGQRVGTGVYLIFCSDQEGERSGMTKVLFIN